MHTLIHVSYTCTNRAPPIFTECGYDRNKGFFRWTCYKCCWLAWPIARRTWNWIPLIRWWWNLLLSSYSYVLIGLTLQDMKQVTSGASNITWGQELFRLVCHMLKSHKVTRQQQISPSSNQRYSISCSSSYRPDKSTTLYFTFYYQLI
jgi:hypothetical protein